jgi:hypothetical protein
MAISFNSSIAPQQTNAASVNISTTPLLGDCIIVWCLSNQGTPSIADNLGGTWTPVVKIALNTGGSRNYSIYQSYLSNCPSTSVRTITWTGGASGQITGTGCRVGGLATVTPYDTNFTTTNGNGSGTALSSNNTANSTTYANSIIFGIGSVDTASALTWTYGNVAGIAAQTTSATASGSGTAPNVIVEYNIVSTQGVYNATASSSVSGHWDMAVVAFADTNVLPVATYAPYSQTQFFQVDNVSHF